jgi:hypothetical protein
LYAVALNQGVPRFVTDNGHYTFVELPEDGAWVHSALSSLSSGWVADGSKLTVFDPILCEGKQLTVQFKAYADASGGTLIATAGGQTARFSLGDAEVWVRHTFYIPGDGQSVVIQLSAEGSVCVATYLVG